MTTRYGQRSLTLLLALVVAPLVLVGCDSGGSGGSGGGLDLPGNAEADKILQQEADAVIFGTYSDLEQKAKTLENEVKDLRSNATTENLEEARKAWIDARDPWEASESFLFGPVAFDGLDPALDSWPADESEIDNALNGDKDLTDKSVVDGFSDSAHGFHTVEFFLFGDPNGTRSVSYFTNDERRLDYLITAAEVLHDDTEDLKNGWKSDASFRSEFVNGSGSFSSKKASLQQLAEGMQIIANEVGANKLGTPINDGTIRNVESKFSGNSFVDFKNNMKSIKRIYTGDVGGNTGQGLDEVIKAVDSDLHDEFMGQIEDAISTLDSESKSTTFRDAVQSGNTSGAKDARNKINTLKNTIVDDIKPAISDL